MSASEKPSFVFTICQIGAEPALKKELALNHPELKFAYSRPGFITFKSEKTLEPDFDLKSVFARAYGLTLTKMTPKDGSITEKAAKVFEFIPVEKKTVLHVWERDQHVPGDEPKGFSPGAWSAIAVRALKQEAAKRPLVKLVINEKAEDGTDVLDLILIESDEWWLGTHRQGPHHSPFPGGKPPVVFPHEAPSRAYVKLEEGLLWSGAQLRKGDVAVEIGSAPGGATYALLQKGLKVVGIDPGMMDSRVLRHPEFQHIQRPVAEVHRDDLPHSVQWLLLDMNVAPGVSLFAVDKLATSMKDSLLGLLLTVKLNQWKFADQIPSMLEHIRSMGMIRAKATQLASNGQEIFIYAVTRKGSVRP